MDRPTLLDDHFVGIRSLSDIEAKAANEGFTAPFSDIGGVRKAAWKQLEVEWHFVWETKFEVDRQAQALIADLQVFLAEFAREELSILPGKLFANIEVHCGKLQIDQLPDNAVVRVNIRLPRVMPKDKQGIAGYAFAVASTLIKMVSASSDEEFLRINDRHFSKGLMNRINRYRSNELLFDEFYSEEAYSELYAAAKESTPVQSDFVPNTWRELRGRQGIHPLYRKEDSLKRVQKRYGRLVPMTHRTVKRLLNHGAFLAVIESLRQEGWKDWHLLAAIEGVRFNYITNRAPYLRKAADEENLTLLNEVRRSGADEDSFQVPVEAFSLDEMRWNIQISQLATLQGFGLSPYQKTPNFDGVDRLLRRFRYWEDDVPHEDPFVREIGTEPLNLPDHGQFSDT